MAIEKVVESAENIGLYIEALDYSPITGTKGNIEYISLFSLKKSTAKIDIKGVIDNSLQLKNGGK
jgi:23S rRNA (cytidine1920-2'-O)/16S rRNA (cytidine1409-2'-O)-methyltransferase